MIGSALEVCTGNAFSAMGPARPELGQTSWPARRIELRGVIDPLGREGFVWACYGAQHDEHVRSVLFDVESDCCLVDPSDLADAVCRLERAGKHCVALVRCALGGAWLAAAACHGVWATPDFEVGLFAVSRVGGLQRTDGDAARANESFLELCRVFRRTVRRRTWQHLVGDTVSTGEHAEATGLVDGIARSASVVYRALGGQTS